MTHLFQIQDDPDALQDLDHLRNQGVEAQSAVLIVNSFLLEKAPDLLHLPLMPAIVVTTGQHELAQILTEMSPGLFVSSLPPQELRTLLLSLPHFQEIDQTREIDESFFV